MLIKRVLFFVVLVSSAVYAESLTLPLDQRPEWLAEEGIVMAGSWEPLLFRVRRDGSDGYTPSAEQIAAYQREQSQEMIERLKSLGVNFVMTHCYKGGGLQAERESMADAVRFAEMCHDNGLRVGVYNYSGAFIWELFFKEVPQAKDWVILDENGELRCYGGGKVKYRYYWNRNHPEAQEFYKRTIRFAVEEVKTDLIHFDNYHMGPGSDANSVQRFHRYLQKTFTPQQLEQMGVTDIDALAPPMTGPPDNMLRRAWLDFSYRSLAESYHDMSRYARSLRKDLLVECNPQGVGPRFLPPQMPVHHSWVLEGGEAFWYEGKPPGYLEGRLRTTIRTYKVARRMGNAAFVYTTTPLAMAESMAFNRDCLGCICWFEYGQIVARPASKTPVSIELAPFIRFFHKRRELFRDTAVIADVAVLRSFPSQVFADGKRSMLTSEVETTLIENRVPFQIIYDQHLDDLERYRALVLAGCVALSDEQIEQIKSYVRSGGRLCIIGLVATHDQWMQPLTKPALDDLSSDRVVRVGQDSDLLDAVHQACERKLSLSVEAKHGLCAEIMRKENRRLIHLVNYRADGPVKDVAVSVRIPAGRSAKKVTRACPRRDADLDVPFKVEEGVVSFTVPAVNVYEIAIVDLK